MNTSSALSFDLLPRGVHPLPMLSQNSNPVLVAINRHHCYVGWAEVTPGADYEVTRASLAAALDRADPPPPDVLDGARHLRLMRFDAYMPPAVIPDWVPF